MEHLLVKEIEKLYNRVQEIIHSNNSQHLLTTLLTMKEISTNSLYKDMTYHLDRVEDIKNYLFTNHKESKRLIKLYNYMEIGKEII